MTDDLVKGLADTLMRAAEEQIANAQTMMDQTKTMVEIMNTQMVAHLKLGEDLNGRFKQAGSLMLDAHRILNGDVGIGEQGTAAPKPTPARDLAGQRVLGAVQHSRAIPPAGSSTFSPNPGGDRGHQESRAGRADLQRALAAVDHPVARDAGYATKQPDRD